MTPKEFLQTVERALDELGISASAFGWTILKDPRFVFDLRKGRDLRASTQQKVLVWIDKAAKRKKVA